MLKKNKTRGKFEYKNALPKPTREEVIPLKFTWRSFLKAVGLAALGGVGTYFGVDLLKLFGG